MWKSEHVKLTVVQKQKDRRRYADNHCRREGIVQEGRHIQKHGKENSQEPLQMQAKIQKGKRTGMEKYKKKKYTDAGVKVCRTTRRKRYSQTIGTGRQK
jgi:formate dehydrogenase assembly factor FdhD